LGYSLVDLPGDKTRRRRDPRERRQCKEGGVRKKLDQDGEKVSERKGGGGQDTGGKWAFGADGRGETGRGSTVVRANGVSAYGRRLPVVAKISRNTGIFLGDDEDRRIVGRVKGVQSSAFRDTCSKRVRHMMTG